ncbi:hypothetical protein ACFFSW_18370 [Saccharothrix longispora]|uniref:Peptidase inhibitor family I36 n=1 Tax=Saccharothrix longispora TaxID=33920 RepID=A0ABU1PS26_9PSEU|nr:hypothetical protein [Saccharothrix longispora]MDR6593450.1 hypothetical protein [Saccharothrix longispora]
MFSLRALRTALSSLAVGALVATIATATAGTASAATYSFTLCNYADDFHVSAYFPTYVQGRSSYSATAWTNQCVVTTHTGGESVGIVVKPDTPQNKALATRYYTTDRSNDVFHTSGSYYSPVIKAHAHR